MIYILAGDFHKIHEVLREDDLLIIKNLIVLTAVNNADSFYNLRWSFENQPWGSLSENVISAVTQSR